MMRWMRSLVSSGKEPLVAHLPKNLGFAIGLDFRDLHLIISAKNPAIIRPGMVFNLLIGFSNVELDDVARKAIHEKSAVKSLKSFGLLLADMVEVTEKGADVLTKHPKSLTDISYTINEDDASAEDNKEVRAFKLERLTFSTESETFD